MRFRGCYGENLVWRNTERDAGGNVHGDTDYSHEGSKRTGKHGKQHQNTDEDLMCMSRAERYKPETTRPKFRKISDAILKRNGSEVELRN